MPTKSDPKTRADDIDRLTQSEIEERTRQTMHHIDAIRALWPGLVRLDEGERRRSLGRNLAALGPPLQLLLGVIRQNAALAKAFDVIGDQDEGHDPEHFEAELLARRLVRVEAERKVADALEDLARHMDDDALATGEAVIGPGLLALGLARTLSKGGNQAFRTALAPVLDAFRELTKNARKGRGKAAAKDGNGVSTPEKPAAP